MMVREPLPGVVYPPEEETKAYMASGELGEEVLPLALKEACRTFARSNVVSGPEGRMTYAELDEKSDRLALALRKLGLNAYDRAIFQLPNCHEIFICLLACWKAQIVPVCTLQAHRRNEIEYLGNHAKARAHLIATDDPSFDFNAFSGKMKTAIASLEFTLVARGTALAGQHGVSDLIDSVDPKEAEAFVRGVDHDPHQVVVFQLSGGSTGIPKIIPRFNNEYTYQMRKVIEANGYTAGDVIFVPLPAIHNASMSCVSFPIFLAGGEFLVSPQMTPKIFFKMLLRYRPTYMGIVGPILDRFVQLGISKKVRFTPRGLIGAWALSRMRMIFSTNNAADVERHLHITGVHIFGMTEGLIMYSRANDPDEARLNTVGTPVSPLDRIKIVEPGTENELPDGEVGEMITKGPYTIHGFYDTPDLNKDSFTSDGFYRTGDLMCARRIEGKTYYAFEGRTKDVVERGGETINCQEVERVIQRHPDVVSAAIVAMPDKSYGERACAFLVARDGAAAPDIDALGRFLEGEGVAKYKWPERIEPVAELPSTKIGKLDKAAMREIVKQKLATESAGPARD